MLQPRISAGLTVQRRHRHVTVPDGTHMRMLDGKNANRRPGDMRLRGTPRRVR
jgi:hypothetical protein